MIPASPAGAAVTPAAANAASSASRAEARRFTRSASGGRALPAASISCQSSGYSRCTRSIHHRGCDQRATGSANTAAFERFALAQETAQQRIDERLGRRARQRRRRVHRVIDDGERRRARVLELIDRDRDETMERRIGDGLGREPAHERIERAPVPQRAVGEFLDEGAAPALRLLLRRREYGERDRQRRTVQHPADGQRRQSLRFAQARSPVAAARSGLRALDGCAAAVSGGMA